MVLLQWLAREIPMLQNLIDRANEKGWRREYPFNDIFRLHTMVVLNLIQLMNQGMWFIYITESFVTLLNQNHLCGMCIMWVVHKNG